MYIKGFGINIDKSKRLWAIIGISLLVAIFLICISFVTVFKFKSKNKYDITNLSELFNAKSYYAEYIVKVTSNKNENEYKIKEWYVNKDSNYKFRIETINNENNFVYIGSNNSICIKSEEQLGKLNIENYDLEKENLLSISTFMQFLYNINLKVENKEYVLNNCCKIKEIQEDSIVKFFITLKDKSNTTDKSSCDICNKFLSGNVKVGKFELVLDKLNYIPKSYIIYDENEKEYINITYTNFIVNQEFEEKLFAF